MNQTALEKSLQPYSVVLTAGYICSDVCVTTTHPHFITFVIIERLLGSISYQNANMAAFVSAYLPHLYIEEDVGMVRD